jgi:hypothetical protein
MPWTEPLANSNELRRCIRDLVALSAGWQNYDMRQIGGSIVAALISILDADFVFIALPGDGNQLISELARNRLTPKSLKHVRTMLQRNSALLGSGQEFVFGDASGGGLHVATRPNRVRWRCHTCRRLFSRHLSNQNGKAAAEYRGQSGGNRLSAVAGRRRETKVHGDRAADNRFHWHRVPQRSDSIY